MKQHITVDQLNELDDVSKNNLKRWWKPQEGQKIIYIDNSGIDDKRVDWLVEYDNMWYFSEANSIEDFTEMMRAGDTLFPLLSIGQMLEFLGNDESHFALINSNDELIDVSRICDTLWEAVKEVLK